MATARRIELTAEEEETLRSCLRAAARLGEIAPPATRGVSGVGMLCRSTSCGASTVLVTGHRRYGRA